MPSTRNTDTTAQATKAAGDTFNAAAQGTQRFTEQVTQLFSLTGERSEELARRSTQNLEAVTEAGAIVTRGVQDLSREWLTFMQERTQKNIEGFTALARCRSLPELFTLQAELVRDNLQQTVESTRRMAEVSTRLVTDASQTVTAQAAGTRRAA